MIPIFALWRRSSVSAFLLVLVLPGFFLSSNAFAQTPKRLQIVVPCYRELDNGNVRRFVRSVQDFADNIYHRQVSLEALETEGRSTERMDFEHIDVVVWVNNTHDVAPEIRDENRRTIEFLKQFIQKGGFNSRLKFHVSNQTNPGYEELNIGQVRRDANAFASSLVPEGEKPSTIRLQADMDTTFPKDLSLKLFAIFDNHEVEWGLLGLDMALGSDSPPAHYRHFPAYQMNRTYRDLLSLVLDESRSSGTPRIVSRLNAFQEVGNFSLLRYAEDADLIFRLQKKFPQGFSFHPEIRIEVAFRARLDSFDGADFFLNKDQPDQNEVMRLEIDHDMEWLRDLIRRYYPAYIRSLEGHLTIERERNSQIDSKRKQALERYLTELAAGVSENEVWDKIRNADEAFFQNSWWIEEMVVALRQTRNNVQAAMTLLMEKHFAAFRNPLDTKNLDLWEEVKAYVKVFAELKKDRKNHQIRLLENHREVMEKLKFEWIQDEVHLRYFQWLWHQSLQRIFQKHKAKVSHDWVYNPALVHAAANVSPLHRSLAHELFLRERRLDSYHQVAKDYGFQGLAESMAAIKPSRRFRWIQVADGESSLLEYTRQKVEAWNQLTSWMKSIPSSKDIGSPFRRSLPEEVIRLFQQEPGGEPVVFPAMTLKAGDQNFAVLPSVTFLPKDYAQLLLDLGSLGELSSQLSMQEIFLRSGPCSGLLRRIGEEGVKEL